MADESEVTLEALEREAAEALKAEEVPPSTEPEETAQGAEEESEQVAEATDAGAEQAEPSGKKMVEVPLHKLTKLREQRRTERDEKERLQKQNEDLIRQLSLMGSGQTQNQPVTVPTLESCDYDESKYQAALTQYQNQTLEQKLQDIERTRLEKQHAQVMQQQLEQSVTEHYKRVESLGVSAEDFIPAEKTLRDTFGDVAVDQLIDAIGEGSEKVVYHLGLNQVERDKVAQLVQLDPSGLKAMTYIGRLAAKLATEPAQNKISQAPAADRPVSGGSTPNTGSSIIKRLKQLDAKPNRDEYRAYKKRVIAAGHFDLLNQHGYA